MVLTDFFEDELERKRKTYDVQKVARDLRVSIKEVTDLYERILNDLKKSARIKEYLSILTSRRVKDILTEKRAANDR